MQELTITDLPEEIIEKIFSEFQCLFDDDILVHLTTCCKLFNAVIGSSPKLMDSFTLFWGDQTEQEKKELTKTTRKYRRISISEASGFEPSLLTFVSKNASTLTHLHLYECYVKASDLEALLSAVSGRLEDISFCDYEFTCDTDAKPIEFPKLKEIDLMYGKKDSDSVLFEFLKGARKVKVFSYENTDDSAETNKFDTRKFCELLSSMEALDELSFCCDAGNKLFKDDLILDYSSKWKLKKFYAWMNAPEHNNLPMVGSTSYDNLSRFIQSQKHLKKLSLCRSTISGNFLEQVLSCASIQSLCFALSVFKMDEGINNIQNTTLKKFSFGSPRDNFKIYPVLENSEYESSICDMLKSCQNLEKLCISRIKITFEMSITINEYLKKLKSIDFEKCELEPFYFQHVRSMTLGLEPDVAIKIIRVNKQLKYIRLNSTVQSHPKYEVAMSGMNLEKIEFSPY